MTPTQPPQSSAYPLVLVIAQGLGADPRSPGLDRDVLECGHSLRAAFDHLSRRYPAKRRCSKCARGLPPDLDPKTVA